MFATSGETPREGRLTVFFQFDTLALIGSYRVPIDPIERPDLGVTVVSLSDPPYQDSWIRRIGHTPESRETLSERLGCLLE